VEELTLNLEKERRRSDEYLTRLKYLQADFENYEKRVKRDHGDLVKMSSERIIVKMLPLLDDLEIAIAEGRKMKIDLGFVKGLEMISANLKDILGQEGVEKIEALGRPFDHSKHEVASFVETDTVAENIVVRELRRGYILNGRVVRPSVVEVARKPLKRGSQNTSKMEITP
jgi:molecular chaperone GrpE